MSNPHTLPCRASGTTIWDNTHNVISNIWKLHFEFSEYTTSCFWNSNWTQRQTRKFQHLEIAFPTCIFNHVQCLVSDTTIWHSTQHLFLNIWKCYFQRSESTMSCFWRRNWIYHPNRNATYLGAWFPIIKLYYTALLTPLLGTTPKT